MHHLWCLSANHAFSATPKGLTSLPVALSPWAPDPEGLVPSGASGVYGRTCGRTCEVING